MTQKQTIAWETMIVGTDEPTQPETYTVRRITRGERHFRWPLAGITMPRPPRDLDAERLIASAAALPNGLRMEFALTMPNRPQAFYITKHTTPETHWAVFGLHCDPIYGEWQQRQMPRQARRWLGCTPWATMLMVAHEVPAWAGATYPDPRRLPVETFVSDMSNLRVVNIDPILYGVMVAGAHWGFVPLAEWKL